MAAESVDTVSRNSAQIESDSITSGSSDLENRHLGIVKNRMENAIT